MEFREIRPGRGEAINNSPIGAYGPVEGCVVWGVGRKKRSRLDRLIRSDKEAWEVNVFRPACLKKSRFLI